MLIFIASFILTVIAAAVQTTNWIFLDTTMKPNLILTTLIILALVNQDWTRRAILILTATLILKFGSGIAIFDLIFIGAVVISFILIDFLPWRGLINTIVATAAGTIIINLRHLNSLPLIYELILNLLLAFILFILFNKLVHVSKIKLQSSRF